MNEAQAIEVAEKICEGLKALPGKERQMQALAMAAVACGSYDAALSIVEALRRGNFDVGSQKGGAASACDAWSHRSQKDGEG